MISTPLILWAVLVQAVIGEQPEESQLPPQIIEGHETIPHQYPFQVSLRDIYNQHSCGGSLISNQWVLTAAHCVATRYFRTPENQIAVQLGSHFRNKNISGETTAFVAKHFIYEHDPHHDVWKHDIALIKLTEPVKLIKGIIWPVELPNYYHELIDREIVTLVGWGVSEVKYFQSGYAVEFCGKVVTPAPSSEYHAMEMPPNCGGTVIYSNTNALFTPYALQHTTIPTVSRDDCYRHIENSDDLREINLDVKLVICVGTQKSSSCSGDSGGPMVKMVNGEWVQFGVTSFGETLCRLDLGPSVYTKVSRYVGWINEIINSNTD